MDSCSTRKLLMAITTSTVVLVFSTPAAAQSTTMPDPAGQTTSSVGVLRCESALAGYRSFQDEPVGSWQDANYLTGQIGGWKAYAREARQRDPTPASPQAGPKPVQGSGSPQPSPGSAPGGAHGGAR